MPLKKAATITWTKTALLTPIIVMKFVLSGPMAISIFSSPTCINNNFCLGPSIIDAIVESVRTSSDTFPDFTFLLHQRRIMNFIMRTIAAKNSNPPMNAEILTNLSRKSNPPIAKSASSTVAFPCITSAGKIVFSANEFTDVFPLSDTKTIATTYFLNTSWSIITRIQFPSISTHITFSILAADSLTNSLITPSRFVS